MTKPNASTLYGLGQGLVDVSASVADLHIEQLQLPRGSSILIDGTRHREVLSHLHSSGLAPTMNPGGSVANSLAAVAQLGGRATLSARIGDDRGGAILCHDFATVGVRLGNPLVVGGETGAVIVLVTPDGERTMLAHPGTAADLTVADINFPLLRRAHTVFLEGYLMALGDDGRNALHVAAREASAQGSLVAISLGAYELVRRRTADFLKILDHTSLLFGNEEEACALVGALDAQEAISKLSAKVPLAVVTCGAKGALIADRGKIELAPAYATNVIDTTGAGDAFAGGFLYGVLNGHPAVRSAAFGNYLASKVVAVAGARLAHSAWDEFREEFHGA